MNLPYPFALSLSKCERVVIFKLLSYRANISHQIDFIDVPVLTGGSLRPFAGKGP
ncbi:hypothetical protein K0504_04310 [Neiella marina]|uniref:Uncharacterized protein n=1 Tax=Neiella holothuriorum TaxID=2870530 RepID=A0ABS7EEY8_9GAMM|nr:hypothetical protein [Neiella holothuriorum]MBW8190252.1 hypothetical protein [Neiella holothuriorum]